MYELLTLNTDLWRYICTTVKYDKYSVYCKPGQYGGLWRMYSCKLWQIRSVMYELLTQYRHVTYVLPYTVINPICDAWTGNTIPICDVCTTVHCDKSDLWCMNWLTQYRSVTYALPQCDKLRSVRYWTVNAIPIYRSDNNTVCDVAYVHTKTNTATSYKYGLCDWLQSTSKLW